MAEFLGTFAFVFIAAGSVLVTGIYGDSQALVVGLAAGLSTAGLMYATVHLSGGHLNPVITLSLWLSQKISSTRAFFYLVAQVAASFAASYLLLYVFGDLAKKLSYGAPVVGSEISLQQAVTVEAVITAVLVFVFMATMVDRRGPVSFGPLVVGLTIAACTIFAFSISGGVLNPARAIGPLVLSKSYNVLVVWVVGPLSGAVFGVVYDFLFLKKQK